MFEELKKELTKHYKDDNVTFEEKNGWLEVKFGGDFFEAWKATKKGEFVVKNSYGGERTVIQTPFGLKRKIKETMKKIPEEWEKEIDKMEGKRFWAFSNSFVDAEELKQAWWNVRNNTPKQVYTRGASQRAGKNSCIAVCKTTKKEDLKWWIRRIHNEGQASHLIEIQSDGEKETITLK